MTTYDPTLTSLIGSRICHDLISPIGAITNGLELLELSGTVAGPELALIGDSIGNAGARIRFFRVAYGVASDELMRASDISQVLTDYAKGGRLRIIWDVMQDVPRTHVRLAFLAIQCLETAMAFGGEVRVTFSDGNWHVNGTADRLLIEDTLWSHLTRADAQHEITPALVQFALLPIVAAEAERALSIDTSDTGVSITL